MTIENTLSERGARYGAFINHAEIAQGIQAVLQKMPNWPTLDYDMRQALVVISDKIARIGNGDPFYSDNWHDVAGYAKLVDDRLKKLEKQAEESKTQPVITLNIDNNTSLLTEKMQKIMDIYTGKISPNSARAMGGILSKDKTYIVGEKGSEDHAAIATIKLQDLIKSK